MTQVTEKTAARFHLSVSPHVRSPQTTGTVMMDVAFALLPALAAACTG